MSEQFIAHCRLILITESFSFPFYKTDITQKILTFSNSIELPFVSIEFMEFFISNVY